MITKHDFRRIDSDSNGNPRYVLPFHKMLTESEQASYWDGPGKMASLAMWRARVAGGTKYRNRNYAIFSSYELQEECDILNRLLERAE